MDHKRITTSLDECNYQVVIVRPEQSKTVFGYEDSTEADEHCMALNEYLQAMGIPDTEIYYTLEMGPNVPEPV